jgi:hypothetical protein
MNRLLGPSTARVVGRIELLARRHRIAHLGALIRAQQPGSIGGEQLSALLRDELATQTVNENRAK